ncbi:hypothetical protein KPL39_02185 [Clostridium gasigenes]|uniref:distal tail protein Dit n=1 Tax=Clostridium gasigenes TaxID=94869 RepID=UPI001C0CE21A|nr:hypothetical protein [Clostridium gasigenes]
MLYDLNLYFNNDSSLNLGMYIVKQSITSPKDNVDEKYIKGKNGTLMQNDGTFKDISINIDFNFIDKIDFKGKCRELNKWLFNIKDNHLYFSDDVNYFYIVKRIYMGDIEKELDIKGLFTVNFICEPFQFDLGGADEIILANNFILENPYFIEAKPVIKLWGEGIVKLNINGNILEVNLGQSIIIDSNLGHAYRIINEKKDFQNTKLKGDYPILLEDENKISWILNVGARLDKATIQPNFKTI